VLVEADRILDMVSEWRPLGQEGGPLGQGRECR
jgi:hypothetical protein